MNPSFVANRKLSFLLVGISVLLFCSLLGLVSASAQQRDPSTPAAQSLSSTPTDFAPFLHLIPSADGQSVHVEFDQPSTAGTTYYVNIGIGPTGHIGSYTGSYSMTYSTTERRYQRQIIGFTPEDNESNALNITSTTGVESAILTFDRLYAAKDKVQFLRSSDQGLVINWVNTNTLAFDTYVVIAPNVTLPGPLPSGHQLIGSSYTVRAPATVTSAERPLIFQLSYAGKLPPTIDPHTLAIFAWDSTKAHWVNLGGQLFPQEAYLTVGSKQFTTYALVATPGWRDEFIDQQGLLTAENLFVDILPGRTVLRLFQTPGVGRAHSSVIAPGIPLRWDRLTFTGAMSAPTTTLRLDLLDQNGALLLPNVTNGSDLSAIDADLYPALRLQATLSSTTVSDSPWLDNWQLTWQPLASAQRPRLRVDGFQPAPDRRSVTATVTLADIPSPGVLSATVMVRYALTAVTPLRCTSATAAGQCTVLGAPSGETTGLLTLTTPFSPAVTGTVSLGQVVFSVTVPAGVTTHFQTASQRVVDDQQRSFILQEETTSFTIPAQPAPPDPRYTLYVPLIQRDASTVR